MIKMNDFQGRLKKNFLIYILLLITFSFLLIPNNDSYYYLSWSQNLQLSYFDGPPMIAYAIRLFTTFFGNSTLAINLTGVFVALLSALVITQIIKTLTDNSKMGLAVALLWITYPFITRYLFLNVTYDALETLFNLLVLLFALKYIKFRQIKYIYCIGIAAGCLLLSKYSGIISLSALIGYFIFKRELRPIFKSYHFYLSILICIIIFMPVIIWNYEHNWASFLFQLKYHVWGNQAKVSKANDIHGIMKVWYYIGNGVIGSLVAYWVILIYLFTKKQLANKIKQIPYTQKLMLDLILTLIIAIFLFWFILSPFCRVNIIYMLYFTTLVIIFAGYWLLQYNYTRAILFIILISATISIVKLAKYSIVPSDNVTFKQNTIDKKVKSYSPFNEYINKRISQKKN